MGLTRRNFLTKLATLPLIGALPFVKARAEPEPTGFSQRLITREMNSGINPSEPIPWPKHDEELRISMIMSNDDGDG